MMRQDIFIDGLGIGEYRSFGRDVQRIGPLKKINLFIGQNNCGKSNILLFLKQHYATALKCEALKLTPVDKHLGETSGKQIVEFGLRVGSGSYEALLKQLEKRLERSKGAIRLVEKVLQSMTLSQRREVAWFQYEGVGKYALSAKVIEDIYEENVLNGPEWQNVWSNLTGRGGGGLKAHWIPETLEKLSPVNLPPPKVDLIPAFREVKKGSVVEGDLSGVGLIEKLMELQNPRLEQLEDKGRFRRINQFVQTVVASPNAELNIPHDKGDILVEMDGKTLPLTSLGTGIHEVIIMAGSATVLQNQVLCIEEPEIHLHPFLQKQLLKYMKEKTSNQYFISTHSAHILDTPDAAVFHVTLENGQSRVKLALSDTAKSYICDDLGYRASDLLQANCVIWVEGPSDRIYLNHWIRSKAPELIEGLHYSIMFYGGRLLSHLTAEDPEVDDFISLRRLNRHISIVIDSDRTNKSTDINQTKERVRDEFNKGPGFAWITEGRVIENYIKNDFLERAVKNAHKHVLKLGSSDKYDNPLEAPEVSSGSADFKVDKVKVAKEVVKQVAQLDVFDLNEKVERIVGFVREANGMDTAS
jgi:hypothetical protein